MMADLGAHLLPCRVSLEVVHKNHEMGVANIHLHSLYQAAIVQFNSGVLKGRHTHTAHHLVAISIHANQPTVAPSCIGFDPQGRPHGGSALPRHPCCYTAGTIAGDLCY